MFTLRFDMRAPAFGAPPPALYAAATDMCAWAETRGALAAVVCEHHGVEDGYLPSPFMLGSAIAARTEHLLLSLVVILPFHEPVRLAEDIAVLDIISKGRSSYIFGIGYRPEEYEHFGLSVRDRGRLSDEKLPLLLRLLSGESVVHDGRRIRVTPAPMTPGGPMMTWGGASLAAARRAGRYGLGLLANGSVDGMAEAYEKSCRDNGFEPGAILLPDRDTPTVTFVADDIDRAWDEIGAHLLHDARSYAEWNPDNDVSAGISRAETVDDLRATSQSHRVLSVGDAVDWIRDGKILNLSPLCGGLSPEVAWPYLRRVAEVVLPEASGSAERATPADTLDELMSNRGM